MHTHSSTALSSNPAMILTGVGREPEPRSQGKSYRHRAGVPLPRIDAELTVSAQRLLGDNLTPPYYWEEEICTETVVVAVNTWTHFRTGAGLQIRYIARNTEIGDYTVYHPSSRMNLATYGVSLDIDRDAGMFRVVARDTSVKRVCVDVIVPVDQSVGTTRGRLYSVRSATLDEQIQQSLRAAASRINYTGQPYVPLPIRKV